MQGTKRRLETVHEFWSLGDAAMARGDPASAYGHYTVAHDLIVDIAHLHEQAHRKLRTVTRLHQDRREFYTDSLLLALAPLGVFHFISFALRLLGRADHGGSA